MRTHPCEHSGKFLSLGNIASAQVILDALAVEIAVGRVQLSSNVDRGRGLRGVSSVLQDMRNENENAWVVASTRRSGETIN